MAARKKADTSGKKRTVVDRGYRSGLARGGSGKKVVDYGQRRGLKKWRGGK